MSDHWTQRSSAHPILVILISGGTKELRTPPRNLLHQPRFLAIFQKSIYNRNFHRFTQSLTSGRFPGGNDTALRPQVDRSVQRSTHTSFLGATDLWGSCCNTRTRSRQCCIFPPIWGGMGGEFPPIFWRPKNFPPHFSPPFLRARRSFPPIFSAPRDSFTLFWTSEWRFPSVERLRSAKFSRLRR